MGNSLQKSTDTSDMGQINNMLGDEDKNIKALTGLVSFGIFKFIVLPYVSELIEMWKSRRVMKDGTEKKFMINPLPQVPTPKSTVVEIPDQPRTPGSIITWERIFF